MRLNMDIIPDRIKKQYNLEDLAVDGWVYIDIRKGMYGLPQSGILANKLLVKRLDRFDYYPVEHTPGLWKHKTRPVVFFPRRRRLWNQIRGQRTRGPPRQFTASRLQNNNRLDRWDLLRHRSQLELRRPNSRAFNAGLHLKSPPQVQPRRPLKATGPTIQA
jgi:hypothetical protein